MNRPLAPVSACVALISFGLVLFELLLTRLFGVVLFAQFAHLALALALLGIGVGAVAQHMRPSLMPAEGLERRLGWLTLVQAGLTLFAVWAVLHFPVVTQFETPPETYQERSSVKDNLLDPVWFAALLPVLAAPFAAAGLAFAGVFQRLRAHIGPIYAADLAGGALGAVAFLPLLSGLAGPDTVWVILALLGAGALWMFRRSKDTIGVFVSGAVVLVGVGLSLVGATGAEVLKIRTAAGYSEDSVMLTRWSPLVRVAVARVDRGYLALLDNSSASSIVTTEAEIVDLADHLNRSLVYRLHDEPARVAILAASAGPEVAVAQHLGHSDITAIDVAGDIFELVRTEFPDNPHNPYLQPGVQTVQLDGRAAILHADQPFDIIHMVHANLWSSAGLLSNAWSPALLETVEAFETYLDQLTPDGTLSFARGSQTEPLLRSAVIALRKRGVTEPHEHVVYMGGAATVMLVKPRPFTIDERNTVVRLCEDHQGHRCHVIHDPMVKPDRGLAKGGRIMTDDRPYIDDPAVFAAALRRAKNVTADEEEPLTVLYRSVAVQIGFVFLAGLAFVFAPMFVRGPAELRGVKGLAPRLLFFCALGYGYLAVETVLIHELVLFVGHPTYAVTVVILAMLLCSGVGSYIAGRIPMDKLGKVLPAVLVAVLGLGAIQGFVVPELLHNTALGLPLGARAALTFAVLAPLGLVMGMPFPLALRQLPERVEGMIPWAWALNGWLSVVAGLATVVLSRMYGYQAAFAVALGAYVIALAVSWTIRRPA